MSALGWEGGRVVREAGMWADLGFHVIEGRGADDRETDEEYVGLGI